MELIFLLKIEHPLKAQFLAEVTDDGIDICVNDEHSEKAQFSIEVTDDGIEICVNAENP